MSHAHQLAQRAQERRQASSLVEEPAHLRALEAERDELRDRMQSLEDERDTLRLRLGALATETSLASESRPILTVSDHWWRRGWSRLTSRFNDAFEVDGAGAKQR
jgi:hypothetical protein